MTRRDPGRLLDDLARGPLDGRAAREARALLEELATLARADAGTVALLTRHAALFSALGLDGEVLAVARAWLGRGVVHPDLARVAATCALVATPKAVELRLRDVATDAEADALRTLRAFMRGDLAEAASAARRHAFFVAHDDLPYAYATAYAAWALALAGHADEGSLVLSSWRERHPDAPARATQFVLRAFGWLAGLAHDHHAALDLLGQALALCEESDLRVERAFVEVELALASRDAGDLDAAKQLVASWEAPDAPATAPRVGLLAGYRDLARAQLALEARDATAALAAAERARTYFERCENVVLACDAQLALCLAEAESGAATVRASLATYRRAARRTGEPRHVRDARVLEEVVPRTGASRVVQLTTRDGVRRAPLVRVVRPGADALASDLYVDTVRREVWASGSGPFVLGEHPVVERTLEVLALAGPSGLPIDALFTAVWGASYHPLRHENKVHVTLHRLRQWLDARGGSAAGQLVVLSGGVVTLDGDADVRVLSFEDAGGFAGRTASRTLRAHDARSSLGVRGRRHGALRGGGLQGQGPEERRGGEGERPAARAAGRQGRG